MICSIICRKCKTNVDNASMFCPHCGVKMEKNNLSQGKGEGIGSLICGIIAIGLWFVWVPVGLIETLVTIVGALLSVGTGFLAINLGKKARDKGGCDGLANAGSLCGSLGMVCSVVLMYASMSSSCIMAFSGIA